MKRKYAFVLLGLFIASVAFAGVQEKLIGVIARKNAATLVDFCTGSDPICEDFEGSSLCFADYDSVCDLTWNALGVTGGSIDFAAVPPGSSPCSGTNNSNVMMLDKSNGSSTAVYVYEDFTAADEIYVKLYYYLDTKLSGVAQINILSLYDGADHNAVQLQQYLSGSTPQLLVRYKSADTPTYVNGSATNISEDTWYKITLRYKKSTSSDGIIYFKVNDTEITNVTNNAATSQIDRLYIGQSGAHTVTWKTYLDNIAVDNDSEPTDCE